MFKRMLIILVAICLMFALAACGSNNPCDDSCAMHPQSGECHCHGNCDTDGCECHAAH